MYMVYILDTYTVIKHQRTREKKLDKNDLTFLLEVAISMRKQQL